jgi:hypothetical protein
LLLSTYSVSEDEDSDDIDVGDASDDDEDESDEEIDEYGPDLYKDEEDKRRQAPKVANIGSFNVLFFV